MKHLLFLCALLVATWAGPARAADGVPARPQPFTFVTDQAGLLQPADVKRLDNGLRQYADNTGTQVVVVTVPTLGGQDVNAFARQLGTSWGVGQKDKNNGLVVLIAKQEHKLSIEPGSGLRSAITPSVVQQAISKMAPDFKQNNYAGGLRQGLNYLMATANPSSAPKATQPTTATAATPAAGGAALGSSATPETSSAMSDPSGAAQTPVEAPSTGLPWGTLLLGGVIIIGGIFLLKKLFSRNSSAADTSGNSPNFYPNRPNQPNAPQGNQPNFYPNQSPGYGAPQQSSGSGMGGILATGAAAAAGAYLGNRLGGSHDDNDSGRNFNNDNTSNNAGLGAGAAAGGAAATGGDDYFASRDNGSDASPDYFSDNASSDSGDYFSGGDSSYDDSSGGGGFDDSSSDNSGSW